MRWEHFPYQGAADLLYDVRHSARVMVHVDRTSNLVCELRTDSHLAFHRVDPSQLPFASVVAVVHTGWA